MKTSRETLIKKVLCVKTNTRSFNKENKLYLFFLHEDFYGFFFDNNDGVFASKFSGKQEITSVFRKKNINKYQKGSFLTINYIITFLRFNKGSSLLTTRFQEKKIYKSFFSFSSGLISEELEKNSIKKKLGFYLILDSIGFILLCQQQKNSFYQSLTRNDLSISLHKPLEFLEKQSNSSSLEFEGSLVRFIHPEILIRILRKKFQDISFLHLLRKFLHFHLQDTSIKEFFSKKIRKIFWNIYVLEIDTFFVSNYGYSCMSIKDHYETNNSLSCLEKFKEGIFVDQQYQDEYFFKKNSKKGKKKEKQIFLDQSRTYKYVRTNMTWFLFFQREKSWNEFVNRRIRHFFVYRLGYVFPGNFLSYHFLFRKFPDKLTSFFFLGYVLHFSKRKNLVNLHTKFLPLIIPFDIRFLCFRNPVLLLIFLLSKQNFCNTLGYPKAKSGWVTLPDSEIINYFIRIRNSLFLFYTGCNNTKSLSRVQYILNLSCAKTLACKHKTSLREISRKFINKFSVKNFSKKQSLFLIPRYSRTSRLKNFYANQKINRVWDFHFIQIDSIFLNLEDLYNFVER